MSAMDSGPLFPPDRVFVVALRRDSEAGPQQCAGRIEQLASGRSASFEGVQELLGFIAAQMHDQRR